MKIGIITITQGTNYGNRLQIYAVQKVLEKLGHEPELLINNTGVNSMWHKVKKCIKRLLKYNNAHYDYLREKSFARFDDLFIKISKTVLDERYFESGVGKKYDAFVCGSDQVWNPYIPYQNGVLFADFPGAKKRISYAASFGVKEIEDEYKEKYRKWLGGFQSISVREDSGKNIVEELINRDAEVLVDPTMMLDASEWEKVEEKPDNVPKGKYAFVYFLGTVSKEISQFIESLNLDYGLEIINVLPEKWEKNYEYNPGHFIYLLHHASIIVTDSFHAVVFSILFEKEFRVFDRSDKKINMSTRLDTILSEFRLQKNRNRFSYEEKASLCYDIEEILGNKRLESIRFLTDALGE